MKAKILIPVIIAVIGLALALSLALSHFYRLGLAAADSGGSGSGTAVVVAIDAAPAPPVAVDADVGPGGPDGLPPNQSIDDFVQDQVGAVDDIKQAKKTSWPLAVLVLLIVIQRSVAAAAKKWDIGPIDWVDSHIGKYLVVGGTLASAMFDVLVIGGTWMAAAYAGVGTLLYVIIPPVNPNKPVEPKPDPGL